MKKEIKFRAFMRGAMHYNVGIHPHICCDHTKQDEEDFFYVNAATTDIGHFTLWNTDDKLMQFTGIKDKNGIDIYEGDFIRLHEYGEDVYKEVVFHNGAFCVHGFNWERKSAEVIGNKYQNPELL